MTILQEPISSKLVYLQAFLGNLCFLLGRTPALSTSQQFRSKKPLWEPFSYVGRVGLDDGCSSKFALSSIRSRVPKVEPPQSRAISNINRFIKSPQRVNIHPITISVLYSMRKMQNMVGRVGNLSCSYIPRVERVPSAPNLTERPSCFPNRG
jgi:hypothetical protein